MPTFSILSSEKNPGYSSIYRDYTTQFYAISGLEDANFTIPYSPTSIMCFAFLRDPNGEVGGSPDSETRPLIYCTFDWANGTNERVGNRCLPGQSLVVQLFFFA